MKARSLWRPADTPMFACARLETGAAISRCARVYRELRRANTPSPAGSCHIPNLYPVSPLKTGGRK
jgi:hypothetical protein